MSKSRLNSTYNNDLMLFNLLYWTNDIYFEIHLNGNIVYEVIEWFG